MSFSLLGLDHVVIHARDLEKMVAFYRDAVGCKEERRLDRLGLVQMRAGRSMIDLLAGRGDEAGVNMDHLCLRIEPFDPTAIAARLQPHGIAPGEVVLRYGAEGEGPSVYFSDPEGNTVEFKGPPGPLP